VDISVIVDNAVNLYKHGVKADIALIYGLSTGHFNPYDMVKLTASTGKILEPDGILLVEDADRIYNIFYSRGYKLVLPEYAGEDRIVLSVHAGYDVRKGVFKRITVDLTTMNRVCNEVHFWDVASSAAILWVFFNDVDFIPIGTQTRGILIARKPRGIDPNQYQAEPTITKPSTQASILF